MILKFWGFSILAIIGTVLFPLQSEERDRMVVVYVKHYLSKEGISYLENHWFPLVHSLIKEQKGFISLTREQNKDEKDCIDILLAFEDDATLDDWIAHPRHDELVDALDPYRSRSYWEAVRTNDPALDPASLEWMTIEPHRKP